jgi:hypothetical protein
LPAVDLLAKQLGNLINVRSTAYLFIDKRECYLSGASFKDGAKKAGTVISQMLDAFNPMWDMYNGIWQVAHVEK